MNRCSVIEKPMVKKSMIEKSIVEKPLVEKVKTLSGFTVDKNEYWGASCQLVPYFQEFFGDRFHHSIVGLGFGRSELEAQNEALGAACIKLVQRQYAEKNSPFIFGHGETLSLSQKNLQLRFLEMAWMNALSSLEIAIQAGENQQFTSQVRLISAGANSINSLSHYPVSSPPNSIPFNSNSFIESETKMQIYWMNLILEETPCGGHILGVGAGVTLAEATARSHVNLILKRQRVKNILSGKEQLLDRMEFQRMWLQASSSEFSQACKNRLQYLSSLNSTSMATFLFPSMTIIEDVGTELGKLPLVMVRANVETVNDPMDLELWAY